MSEVVLDGTAVGNGHPPYVIAEAGSNHGGNLEEAKKLIAVAAAAGANACKFQKRANRELYTESYYDAPYDNELSYGKTYGEHRDFLEFDRDQYRELQSYAAEHKISFIATPFDIPSVEFLENLGVPYYKVASGSVQNPLLLRAIGRVGKPVVISFGGARSDTVFRAVSELEKFGCPLVLLHCTAAYPAPPAFLGLKRIGWLKEKFPQHVVGFSDHDDGVAIGVAAYAWGAKVFEKHITLDHSNRGTDHAFSLEPGGLQAYVRNLKETWAADQLLDHPVELELKPIYKMGSGVYPRHNLEPGQVITSDDLVIKSPADGLSGWAYDELIGRRLNCRVKAEQPLRWEYFDFGDGA